MIFDQIVDALQTLVLLVLSVAVVLSLRRTDRGNEMMRNALLAVLQQQRELTESIDSSLKAVREVEDRLARRLSSGPPPKL
jgi:hypothetical protein